MRPTALIVDEEASATAPLEELLRDRFAAIRTAGSAAEALEQARTFRPDVVVTPFPFVCDDGSLLTRILKQDPGTSECAVVAWSDWGWANTRAKAFAAGCDAFVPRTASAEELLRAVDRVLARQGAGRRTG